MKCLSTSLAGWLPLIAAAECGAALNNCLRPALMGFAHRLHRLHLPRMTPLLCLLILGLAKKLGVNVKAFFVGRLLRLDDQRVGFGVGVLADCGDLLV